MNCLSSKQALCEIMRRQLTESLLHTDAAMQSLREARDAETRSTAGDKYETGRAMMQIEMQKLSEQIARLQGLLRDLDRVPLTADMAEAALGSLVFTPQTVYFLSAGMGRLEHDGQVYYAVSLASPVGQVLRGKRAGDTAPVQGKPVQVLRVC